MAIGISIRGSKEGILFDAVIMDYVHSRTTPSGIAIMKKITYFGSVHFFLPIGILMLLILLKKRNVNGIILLLSSILGGYGLNILLKSIFIRTRPLEYFLIEQGGYSFPSGHAMMSMIFYTTITHLLIENEKRRGVKKILWTINCIVIALIGFSRIYLGVHWPTDILMGYVIGYIFYYIVTRMFTKKLSS